MPADSYENGGISLGVLAVRIGAPKSTLSHAARKGNIPRNADTSYDEDAVRAAIKANPRMVSRGEPGDPPIKQRVGNPGIREDLPVIRPGQGGDLETLDEAVGEIRRMLIEEGWPIRKGEPITYTMAQTAEKIAKVRHQKQLSDIRSGRLLDADEVLRKWETRVAKLRAGVLALLTDIAVELPHFTKHDLFVLDQLVRAMLTRIFREIESPTNVEESPSGRPVEPESEDDVEDPGEDLALRD